MVFQIQLSNKGRKKALSRRRKQGSTYAAHQAALDTDPEQPPDTANEAVGDVIPPSASSNTRKDNNWRSNRAAKSAKRAIVKATAKAIVEMNAVRVDIAATKSKLQAANARVKQAEHEQYWDKKASRVHALKTEEEHKLALDQLSAKFYEEVEAAEEVAGVETAKRLAEEARRIEAEDNHSRLLCGERQHYANKVKREQAKLEKERHGQQLQIDHLHNQWKQQLAVSTTKLERENAARAATLTKEMDKNAQKSEETLKKETTKLMNKLEKKEQMLDSVKDGNKKR